MSESFSPLVRLSSLLEWVREFPQQTKFEADGPKLRDSSPLDRIRYCSQALLKGALPDAETLEFVAISFNKYAQSGKKSLDEAFGLRSKPKGGNPARQFKHKNRIDLLLLHMVMMRARNPRITLPQAAECALKEEESALKAEDKSRGRALKAEERALSNETSISGETLEREYRRRSCAKWLDSMGGK